MKKLDYKKLEKFIARDVVKVFYDKKIEKLKKVNMKGLMKRKNPYLFKAKNIQITGDLAKDILDAHLSSQEETIFGALLENLAIHINGMVYSGKKAEEKKFKSVDLIFTRESKVYVVGIKSGPNWGNSDQINAMKKNLKKAKEILVSKGETKKVIGINGCAYGRDNSPYKIDRSDNHLNYYKMCGQDFWELISGDKDLYKKFIKPLDKEVEKKHDKFVKLRRQKINEMTKDLIELFYTKGDLDWNKIVEYVSKSNNI